MKNLIATLFLCLFSVGAFANQARAVGARIGSTTLTSTGCNSIPYSSTGYDLYILVEQVSQNSNADITAFATYTVNGVSQTVQTTTKNVVLIKDQTIPVLIGHINTLTKLQYSFSSIGMKVCYPNECDTNPNNSLDKKFCVQVPQPLPVELSSFTLSSTTTTARLNWTTASEKNTSRFAVEMSNDGLTFREIGEVLAGGSSSTPRAYSFISTHLDVAAYYRLKIIDTDNTFSYSPVLVLFPVSMGNEYLAGADGRYIAFHLATGEIPLKLYLLDTSGRVLYEQAYDPIIRYPLGQAMVIIRLFTNTGSQYSKLYR